MKSNKNYPFLILLSFLILPILCSSSCTPKCGDIQIPFPFGIETGCYLDEWYQIDCQRNAISGKDFPLLRKINMEVVNISLPAANYDGFFYRTPKFASVRVKSPITSVGCASDGKEFRSTLNLTNTPFFLGEQNSLVAVGCNNKASLTYVEPKMVGCESTCTTSNKSQRIPFFDKVGCSRSNYSNIEGILPTSYIPVCNTTKKEVEDTICNGNGCCLAQAPEGAKQLIGVTITNSSNGNLTTGGECRVAFLTDEVYTLSNVTKPESFFSKGYATVSLGWFIQTRNHSFLPSLDCQNREEFVKPYFRKRTTKCICDNSTISGISYASCACFGGFRGNPYLFDNCVGK